MTVYVVQEVAGRNILPASQYGEITVMLPPGQVTFSIAPTITKLKNYLRDFSDADYLLLSGDPIAIGLACSIASKYGKSGGTVNLLKWDRQEMCYIPLKAQI